MSEASARSTVLTRWLFPLGLIWAGLLVSVWVRDQIPRQMQVETLRSAITFLAGPFLALIGLVGLRAAGGRMRGSTGRIEDLVVVWVLAFFIALHVLVLAVAIGLIPSLPAVLPFASGVFLIGLGPLLARLPHDSAMGIRTAGTLSSREAWRRTHRLLAVLFPSAGVLGLVALRLDGIWLFVGAVSPAFLALSLAILHGSRGRGEH